MEPPEEILSSGGPGEPGPQIGSDEWVARLDQRREYVLGKAQRLAGKVGWWPRLAIVAVIGLLLPSAGLGGFQLQVGIDSLVIALLAVGLNIVVGWAGLLDLGFVAFFGFGAYGFAVLSSAQDNIHWAAWASVPAIAIGAAALGFLVGLPSRRLIGDYLAIVTLFFGEAFVEFTDNVAPSKFGGANGIVAIDPIRGFGVSLTSNRSYFILLVLVVTGVMAVLRLLEKSRTGRAWRAVQEDPLAAASMTIPVNRVKLMAFASGAAVAALAGTIYAAQQVSVFPTDFDTPVLILVYAGLILGGAGSIAGACAGALVVMVVYDGVLRGPAEAAVLFYAVIALTLLARLRPWRRLGLVLLLTAPLGVVTYLCGHTVSNKTVAGNWGFVLLICLLIALVQLSPGQRTFLLPVVLCVAAFTWQLRLISEPSITRQLMIGAILIVLMNARPQGLLGSRRVEVAT